MKRRIFIRVLACSFLLGGCTYDKAEVLSGINCDTTNVTYSVTIKGILKNNFCLDCHGTPATNSAPFSLDSYSNLNAHLDRIIGAIEHQNGFIPMPLALPKMSQCDIDKVKAWKNAGALNN